MARRTNRKTRKHQCPSDKPSDLARPPRSPHGFAGQDPADKRVRSLMPRRRVRQPHINPMELWHNQVTRMQGPFSFPRVPPHVGLIADPGQRGGPLYLPGLPVAGPLRPGAARNPVRHHRHQLHPSQCAQGQEDVRADPRAPAWRDPSSSAGTSPTWRACTSGSMPTTSFAARACAGSRQFLGEDADKPVRHPQLWGGFSHRVMGMNMPFNSHIPRRPLIRRWAARSAANFCSTWPCLAARAIS